jgi:cytochrome b subunit of formate dehydrogenase
LIWKSSHAVHALTFLALLGTGLLLFFPVVRAQLIGGYSLHLRVAHFWVGIAFALASAPFVRPAIRPMPSLPAAEAGAARRIWRRFHLLFTLGATVTFTVSGLILWFERSFPLYVLDASALAHRWLTYGACAVLMVHLAVAVLRSRVRLVRERLRVGAAPLGVRASMP